MATAHPFPLQPGPGALVTGMRMTRESFLRLWDRLPSVKNAELIDGVVYVASPVGIEHSGWDIAVHWWLKSYVHATPGVEAGSNATWNMLTSAPQPDAHLCLAQSANVRRIKDRYHGAPDLAIEISESSVSVDFGSKLLLYARAGVKEYLTFEPDPQRLTWRRLVGGAYQLLKPGVDGIHRSRCFPGLWLDQGAFWAGDGPRLQQVLEQGLADATHTKFARRASKLKR